MQAIAEEWLRSFALAASPGDVSATLQTFLPNGWLRDVLVFTWNTRTLEGQDKIAEYLQDTLPAAHLAEFKLDDTPGLSPESTLDGAGIATSFTFEMPRRRGRGYAYLLKDDLTQQWKALSVCMFLVDIKGHEEVGPELGTYGEHTIAWEEINAARRARIESNPHVLIMGGGQTGLQIAARFRQMDIDTIVIEKNASVGDQWMQRYPTLSLHTTRNHHTLLYQPYPQTWPLFTPRDKVAAWLRQYAESQDLIVWTNSYMLPTPTYDRESKKWSVKVNKNGTEVTLHPAHIVVAIGTLGPPRVPQIPGAERFQGTIMHASAYMGGESFAGKRAVVLGAANTSADICQDLAYHGAQPVTMVQRSSTCVVSIESIKKQMAVAFPDGMPPEICDLRFYAMPIKLQRALTRAREAELWEREKVLHAKLKSGGLKLNMGTDGSGQHFLIFDRSGGYWVDVGVADMIEAGKIKIKQGVEIQQFTEDKVIFTDESELPADVVVLATGYIDPRESLKKLFGADVINQTSELWGLDEEGEPKGCYKYSGYPGLWYGAGDFSVSRFLSKQLALQIKAQQLGMV